MSHLRIADHLLAELPELNEAAFTFGNLAPDSGVPNETWTEFDPPKEVTHFLKKGEGEESIRDMEFYRTYLEGAQARTDMARYSFFLGYFCHLVTDNLWTLRVWRPSKQYFVSVVSAKGILGASWDFKADWYDLDHRYARDNPECLFWRVFVQAPLPPAYLPFLPETAIHHQFQHIRKFYGEPVAHSLDRMYPFLNENTMSKFVDDTAASILKLHRLLLDGDVPEKYGSAVAALPAEEIQPYVAPLG